MTKQQQRTYVPRGELMATAEHAWRGLGLYGGGGPSFGVRGASLALETTPQGFYQDVLIQGIRNARTRIVIASLYLGTGQKERTLVNEMREALRRYPHLKATLLFDRQRASRVSRNAATAMTHSGNSSGADSARSLLLPLVQEFPDRVTVALYTTPNTLGGLSRLLPDRWNEIAGVQVYNNYTRDGKIHNS